MSDLGILGLLALHLVVLALPGVAAALFAARRGARSVPILLALALAATGVAATLSFWLYFAGPTFRETWGFALVIGSVATIVASLRGGRIPAALLGELATPLVLWALGSAFLVFLGFLHGGGAGSALTMSTTRFSGALPSDNEIPHFFAEWFFAHGHGGTVPAYSAGWLFSDRPPLQVGYALAQRNLGPDPGSALNYQLIGVAAQQLWIVGLWALLGAARVRTVTRALVMATVLVSGVAIVNGFFVWPKLLPAAMVLAAAALVLAPEWTTWRRDPRIGALVAALLGLAMLGHGSSVFAVVPLALVAALRGLPSWRWLAVALAAGLVLMAPWSAYQKYGDPPGNRLTKWMLAGETGTGGEFSEREGRGPTLEGGHEPTAAFQRESALGAIGDAYGRVGLGGALHDKAENFLEMAGGGPVWSSASAAADALGEGRVGVAVREVRGFAFYGLLPSLGLLALAPLIMLAARRRPGRDEREWRFALLLYFVFAVAAVIWGALLFGNSPARAYLQSGTYVLPILGLAAGVVGLRAVLPRFANWYAALAAALSLALYVPALTPPAGLRLLAAGGALRARRAGRVLHRCRRAPAGEARTGGAPGALRRHRLTRR